MYYLPFETLIQELSERWTGSQIELNGAVSCVIRTESDFEIFLEADPSKPIVQAVCFLGAVPRSKEAVPLMVRLLQENLPHQKNGIFGVDVEGNQFTLHKGYSLENLSADTLSAYLLILYNRGHYWSQIIKGERPLSMTI